MAKDPDPKERPDDYGSDQLRESDAAMRGMEADIPAGSDIPFQPMQPPLPPGIESGEPPVETNATGRVSDGRPDIRTPGYYGQETDRTENTEGELSLQETAQLASDALDDNMTAITVVLEQLMTNQKALSERLNTLIDKTDSEDAEDEF